MVVRAVSLFPLMFFTEGSATDGNRVARELFGLFLIFWGLLIFLSLATYDNADPGLNHVVTSPVNISNAVGLFGAYLSGMLVDFFGIAAYVWAVAFIFAGARRFIPGLTAMWWRWTGVLLCGISLSCLGAAGEMSIGHIAGGGFLGTSLHRVGWYYLRPAGASLLWLFITLCGLQLTFGSSWAELLSNVRHGLRQLLEMMKNFIQNAKDEAIRPPEERRERKAMRLFRPKPKAERGTLLALADGEGGPDAVTPNAVIDVQAGAKPARTARPAAPEAENHAPGQAARVVIDDPHGPVAGKSAPPRPKARSSAASGRTIRLPGLDLLSAHTTDAKRTTKDVLENKGRMLIECLADFGVQGELQRITPGPVVTMFEIKPAPGVKVSRIANLADDLAMALRAISIRIQAPIPGKDSVGIEIPNDHRETVCLRELIASDIFRKADLPLTLAIGKDISGAPFAADLAKMPHLLVAGATGQGKSVFINSVLMSLLFRTTPEELKLLLIDPKRIELAVYADMPHLVHPVVTDMSQAKNALDWAVHEMDRRYEAMAVLGVRNIIGYNEKLKGLDEDRPEQFAGLEFMPYLVIIIDELADLMLTAAKEVETSIVRLAQLARAAGIHLILATQRPSVDVVTGLIKANFPCRISFQVTAKHDSRTILDTVGAEHLLGKGDMLFKAGGGKLQRMHGAFVSDEDVGAVVSYWKSQMPATYNVDFAEWGNEGTGDFGFDGNGGPAGSVSDDPMYSECIAFVMQQGKASISLIQRRFRIGFNRAARYVEQMEQDGIIGPADGSKPRAIIGGGSRGDM